MARLLNELMLGALGLAVAYGCSGDDGADLKSGAGGSGMGGNTPFTGMGGVLNSIGGAAGEGGQGQLFCDEFEELGDCGAQEMMAQTRSVNMLIVLDKSGSMQDEVDGLEKWQGMKDALSTALRNSEENINFGLQLFPVSAVPGDPIPASCGDRCCELQFTAEPNVRVGRGADAVDDILAELDAISPSGGTPTAEALEHALEYFEEGAGSSLEGDRFVLLATDGGPNCNDALECDAAECTLNLEGRDSACQMLPGGNCCDPDDGTDVGCLDADRVLEQVEALKDVGIDTFVVGVPGSEAYSEMLNELALAGGRATGAQDYEYYRVNAVDELSEVLSRITLQLLTDCEISLASPPPDPQKVNLAIDCSIVPQSEGAAGAGGQSGANWRLESNDDGEASVTIRGAYCDQVRAGVERIDVIFGCQTLE